MGVSWSKEVAVSEARCRRGGLRHRVVAAVAPGMAAQQTRRAERRCRPAAPWRSQRLERVGRTGRLEAAGVAQPGLEQQAVGAHQRDQQRCGGRPAPAMARSRGLRLRPRRLRPASASSSLARGAPQRLRCRRLGSRPASNGARKRTSHSPCGKRAWWRSHRGANLAAAAGCAWPPCARAAWARRSPSQHRSGTVRSSHPQAVRKFLRSPVDNSLPPGLAAPACDCGCARHGAAAK